MAQKFIFLMNYKSLCSTCVCFLTLFCDQMSMLQSQLNRYKNHTLRLRCFMMALLPTTDSFSAKQRHGNCRPTKQKYIIFYIC